MGAGLAGAAFAVADAPRATAQAAASFRKTFIAESPMAGVRCTGSRRFRFSLEAESVVILRQRLIVPQQDQLFKHDFSTCAVRPQGRRAGPVARVRFVPAIRQRMDAEAESAAELSTRIRIQGNVPECRHEQN